MWPLVCRGDAGRKFEGNTHLNLSVENGFTARISRFRPERLPNRLKDMCKSDLRLDCREQQIANRCNIQESFYTEGGVLP